MSSQAPIQDVLPSESVIHRIADHKGVDPLELTPLYESIDPDALDALVRTASVNASTFQVEFTHQGCDVTVSGDGSVHVDAKAASVGTK